MPTESGNSNRELGQILREVGWISAEQLRQALQTQGVLGGRLGTCLLESDALTEAMLNEALSRQCGVPPVRVIDLHNIPPEVLGAIDRATAASLPALPFRLLGSDLYVAVLDPADSALRDRLEKDPRWHFHFYVASEVRLFAALQRHYGRPLSERFVQLEKHLEQLELAVHRSAPVAAQLFEFATIGQSIADWSLVEGGQRRSAGSEPAHSGQIVSATSVEEIGERAVEALRSQAGRLVLFRIRAGNLVVWRALGLDPQRAAQIKLSLNDLPTLGGLTAPNAYHFGPIADEKEFALLASELGGAAPGEVLIVPVFVSSRLVAAILLEPGSAGVDAIDVGQAANVASQIAVGLRTLVLNQHRTRVSLTPSVSAS